MLVKNHCDICGNRLIDGLDDLEERISQIEEINESFESEYDEAEPKLLLCGYCQKEYQIPEYPYVS